MIPARVSSWRSARCGLLIVALLHFVAAAALPIAHAHAPPTAAGNLEAARSAHQAHTELCAVCRSFGAAHTTPQSAAIVAQRAAFDTPIFNSDVAAAPTRILASSQPRAPPRA